MEINMGHAADYLLKIDGIEGESRDAMYKGTIELQSWNWFEANGPTTHGRGPAQLGRVVVGQFVCTFPFNKASVKLTLANANGEHIKKAILFCRKPGGRPHTFFIMTMHDIIISACNVLPGGADFWPLNQIGIAFSRVEWEFRPQRPDGTSENAVKTGWDVKKNHAV
jgi:type VI secretion system secreted protein Hcp